MADKDETIRALTAQAWTYTPDSTTTLRRLFFLHLDVFVFDQVGDYLTMTVYEPPGNPSGRLVLGKPLLLTWDPQSESFTETAYGRHMRFRALVASIPFGFRMRYDAHYEAPPHNGPDEGGDGDP